MKTFTWEFRREVCCEPAYNYVFHVQRKNIQEVDFVRGFTSLPHNHANSFLAKDKVLVAQNYRHLKEAYGFFEAGKVKP